MLGGQPFLMIGPLKRLASRDSPIWLSLERATPTAWVVGGLRPSGLISNFRGKLKKRSEY